MHIYAKTNYGTDISESLQSLYDWLNYNGYYGWDPYDGLNNDKFKNLPKYGKIALIQVNKYSPINLRPILGIEKGFDLKGNALLSQGYSKLYNISPNQNLKNNILERVKQFEKLSLKNEYGFDCWASHYYPFISTGNSHLSVKVPDIIGTSQVIKSLYEAYIIYGDEKFKNSATSALSFIFDKLYQENNGKPFFRYSAFDYTKNTNIINASSHALEAFSKIHSLIDDKKYQIMCNNTIDHIISLQSEDGSWVYSTDINGKVTSRQLDFHQGYILDGLYSCLDIYDDYETLSKCITKGAEFYWKKLFQSKGISFYRYPIKYPIDIHNQAQGIITFSKLSNIDKNYSDYADEILNWTIKNMQDQSGFFYFQKWPFITNKIPHLRWNQAWMLLALTTYLENKNGGIKY